MTTRAKPVAASVAPAATTSASPMRLSYLIGQLDRIVSRRLSEALAEHGLTLPQFTALSVLNARGRSSNAQLAERSFITPQSANEVVKTMEANGWVMREPDPNNKRIVLLQLTAAGKTMLRRCDEMADRVERTMLDTIDDADARALRALLQSCVKSLRAS
ncbi:MarR family winged helix-turn-helix transcriptional regulator [Pararobbsia silviterrae]|uniref:MarR family transcriptional regulator n=1 Tax=Pararobbsia silviterrae TaxID=1792498 RepID=A0A494XNN2_9BURK|nr:MarR family transcriptional regulator [Pararobbsia silviterrae]RKP49694.1 MarR family transcriptional regulator [Pararobbsia silviterrae]